MCAVHIVKPPEALQFVICRYLNKIYFKSQVKKIAAAVRLEAFNSIYIGR